MALIKEMDGLDCSTSGGTGLDGVDSNHGGVESVICSSESGGLVKDDLNCESRKSVGCNSGSRGPIGVGFETFCGSVWKERI